MKEDKQPIEGNSRSQLRTKRRKTNVILNGLIIVVLLLIIIFSYNIFFGKKDKSGNLDAAYGTADNYSNKSEINKSENANNQQSQNQGRNEEFNSDNSHENDEINKNEKDLENKGEDDVVTEEGNNPEVKRTLVNPSWKPIGTSQTGEHTSVYSGVDWDEMVHAISYGTGIDQSNMTILFLGNNGPNKSVGSILQKDTKQKYRVYIEWVEEQGWKPTKVEELNK